MKQQLAAIFLLTLLAGSVAAQSLDQKIEKIRKLYEEVAKDVEQADKTVEDGEPKHGLVVHELALNQNNRVWPGCGTYRMTYRFYYSDDTPDQTARLVRVTVHTQYAAHFDDKEFLASENGSLLFYFEKTNNAHYYNPPHPVETRVYFSNGKAIRRIGDEKVRDKLTDEDTKEAEGALAEWSEIRGLFKTFNNLFVH